MFNYLITTVSSSFSNFLKSWDAWKFVNSLVQQCWRWCKALHSLSVSGKDFSFMAKVISASLTGTLEPKSLALSALSTPGRKKSLKDLNFSTVLRVLTRKINAVSTYESEIFQTALCILKKKKTPNCRRIKKCWISKNKNKNYLEEWSHLEQRFLGEQALFQESLVEVCQKFAAPLLYHLQEGTIHHLCWLFTKGIYI